MYNDMYMHTHNSLGQRDPHTLQIKRLASLEALQAPALAAPCKTLEDPWKTPWKTLVFLRKNPGRRESLKGKPLGVLSFYNFYVFCCSVLKHQW